MKGMKKIKFKTVYVGKKWYSQFIPPISIKKGQTLVFEQGKDGKPTNFRIKKMTLLALHTK